MLRIISLTKQRDITALTKTFLFDEVSHSAAYRQLHGEDSNDGDRKWPRFCPLLEDGKPAKEASRVLKERLDAVVVSFHSSKGLLQVSNDFCKRYGYAQISSDPQP